MKKLLILALAGALFLTGCDSIKKAIRGNETSGSSTTTSSSDTTDKLAEERKKY